MSLALKLACCILCLATILPLLSTGAWLIRLCDFPRIQLMAIAVAILLLLTIAYRCELDRASILTMLFATSLSLAWQASHVWPYTSLARKDLPDTRSNEIAPIRLAVVNLQFENTSKAELVSQLERLEADMVLLIEVDQAWDDSLRTVYARFPHKFGVVREKGLGLQLLCQYPFETKEVRHLVDEDRPSLWCSVRVANQLIHYIGLHPTPPGLPVNRDTGSDGVVTRHDSRIRDAELMLVAKEVAEEPRRRWIVAGDFNDVAWSHTTRLFKRLSGLSDPRVGRGLYNSYHA